MRIWVRILIDICSNQGMYHKPRINQGMFVYLIDDSCTNLNFMHKIWIKCSNSQIKKTVLLLSVALQLYVGLKACFHCGVVCYKQMSTVHIVMSCGAVQCGVCANLTSCLTHFISLLYFFFFLAFVCF